FVTAGPWRGVYLEDAALPRLENVYLRTLRIDPARAYVEIVMELLNVEDGQVHVVVELNGNESVRTTVDLDASDTEIFIPFVLDDPQLWWPRGSGEAYLYDMEVEVIVLGHTIHEQQPVGIRTVELDQSDGAFTFVINGEITFVKGSNSAPMTSLYPVSEERYRTVLQASADANMNMLRVWGGGVYEDDLFYDLADSLGIMVWQDFMFANALYPGTDAFMENVRREATEQVQRLRRHPSVVLWCGNNEISEGWHNWGWQETLGYSEAVSHAVWQDYQQLFAELLPDIVSEHHEGAPYLPSSPSNGWGRDIAYEEGDVHYWGVWWGRAPFEMYREKIGRFNSEYGFQAYPVEATVRTFANDLGEDSDAFRNHQKHPNGEEWLREYALMTFGYVPEDPGLWRYMTQVMQAEGVGMAIAGHRANKPRTMGTLYWQLNDVWPVISWSSMDMFGRWKPLHYHVRDLYQTLFAEVYQDGDSLRLRVVSDSLLPVSGRIHVEAFDTHSGLVWADSMAVTIPANGGVDVVLDRRDVIAIPDERLVFRIVVFDGERRILRATSSLAPRWDLSLPDPDLQMRVENHQLRVAAARPALGVWIEDTEHGVNLPLNYLDLFPGDAVEIDLPEAVDVEALTLRSIYDLQRP
ncbi:MAG: glycoside hydrolase family 2 protein, partial [Bacteroidetes bacterium]|nr:glycoside hydrolase family 2 protein [Bacteroidota bacterium]